jgi:hypothetical protein
LPCCIDPAIWTVPEPLAQGGDRFAHAAATEPDAEPVDRNWA